ncbi:winged helix DNA-binding protein [Streptomyces sp. MMBL 11-3]|uniref:winged helix DNA-binding protein n=1 Tax=Streptomyces sp. MMBL 11-3 TaxID=3382639 RepID=UPI0039B6B086
MKPELMVRILTETELLPVARLTAVFLHMEEEPKTTAEVARWLSCADSTALRALKALQAHGWADRHPRFTNTWVLTEELS